MIAIPEPMWTELTRCYADPPRAYHTLEHVRELVALHEQVAHDVGWGHSAEVYVAMLCHDAIYEVARADNEARSAELARAMIARWLPASGIEADYVAELIELTARHGQVRREDVSGEQGLFLDCDMAILGAEPDRFARYERGVRTEYSTLVTPSQYTAGRAVFLRQLLEAERIFLSDYFHQRLDRPARRNLSEQLDRLDRR